MRQVTLVIIALLLIFWGAVNAFAATALENTMLPLSLCQTLTKHVPDASVAYQAGVDVHGKSVPPADLAGDDAPVLPAKIKIPITINLAKILNLNAANVPFSQLGQGTEASLGALTVEGGKVLFNGEPLSSAQQDNLSVLCMKP